MGKEETILFLTHLLRYIKTPLLVVWDPLSAHRSRLVGQFLDTLGGRIAIEYLPPYAPEFAQNHCKQRLISAISSIRIWESKLLE